MKKSIVVIPKPSKGGRPATGRDPVRAIRLSDDFLSKVDNWAVKQDVRLGRSEAIRKLVEIGLSAEVNDARPKVSCQRLRAREMAAGAIDKLIDKAAPSEEQASRKHSLLKGPEEFQESRIDRPKAKR